MIVIQYVEISAALTNCLGRLAINVYFHKNRQAIGQTGAMHIKMIGIYSQRILNVLGAGIVGRASDGGMDDGTIRYVW